MKPARVVDPTGCGDAYRAGLLLRHRQRPGLGDHRPARFALGSIKIAERGAQNHQFSRDEIGAAFPRGFGRSRLVTATLSSATGLNMTAPIDAQPAAGPFLSRIPLCFHLLRRHSHGRPAVSLLRQPAPPAGRGAAGRRACLAIINVVPRMRGAPPHGECIAAAGAGCEPRFVARHPADPFRLAGALRRQIGSAPLAADRLAFGAYRDLVHRARQRPPRGAHQPVDPRGFRATAMRSACFPEGTTTRRQGICNRFHASLLQPAVDEQAHGLPGRRCATWMWRPENCASTPAMWATPVWRNPMRDDPAPSRAINAELIFLPADRCRQARRGAILRDANPARRSPPRSVCQSRAIDLEYPPVLQAHR